MKVLVIFGGARKGNTIKTLHTVQNTMQQINQTVVFKEIWLQNLQLPFCCSCYTCFFKGENSCPHSKIVQPVFQEMVKSNSLILATPVYSMQVSAVMKNFIDHLSFAIHRPPFPGKKAMVITTTAGSGHIVTSDYLKSILHFWGCDKVYTNPIRVAALDLVLSEKQKRKIEISTTAFYQDIAQKKKYSPTLKNLFYFSIWKAMNSMGENEGTIDYQYWQKRNWLQKDYFHPISQPKRIIGRAMSGLFKIAMRYM